MNTNSFSIDNDNKEVRLFLLEQRQNDTIKNYETLYNGLQNQLTFFGIGSAIILGLLGYFAKKYFDSKVEEIDAVAKSIDKIKLETNILFEDINHNISKIYGDLKKQETLEIIKRLQRLPEDIQNLVGTLLSREIPAEYFEEYKIMFINAFKASSIRYIITDHYITLTLQHFPGKFISDIDMEPYFPKAGHFGHIVNGMYLNDIENFLHEMNKVKKIAQQPLEIILNLFLTNVHWLNKAKEILNPSFFETNANLITRIAVENNIEENIISRILN